MNEQKNWPYSTVVAHRGGGRLAPENTLAAIEQGYRLGHTMVEFDVKLSADGQLFLLHDDSLDRTTNSSGLAGEQSWSVLSTIDAGSWFDERFRGVKLPLFSEVAECCGQYQLQANIEIKPSPGQDELTGKMVALAAQQLWQGATAPLLSSFSTIALAAAQHAAPELPLGLLLDEWCVDWQEQAQRFACISVHLNHQVLTKQRVDKLRSAGLYVMAYTVNDPQRARELLSFGVNTICTDAIDLITCEFSESADY